MITEVKWIERKEAEINKLWEEIGVKHLPMQYHYKGKQ